MGQHEGVSKSARIVLWFRNMLWRRGCRNQAFTLVELGVVVVLMAMIALVLLPTLRAKRAKSQGIACVGNLKQVGLAFRIFAVDHEDRMPMQVWTNEPDQQVGFPLKYFLGMSNELSTPLTPVRYFFSGKKRTKAGLIN